MNANRRELFAALMAAAAARQLTGADDPVTIAGKRPMIVHNDRPEDLETLLKDLNTWLTPVDGFFVRQHIPRPEPIDPAAHRVKITGMVSKPAELSLADLQKLPAILQSRGYSSEDIQGIMHGNWLDLMRRSWSGSVT